MKKLIFILSLFLLSKLNAQNHFFEEGQTGYTVSGNYAISSFENLSDAHYGISSNYTFNGKLTWIKLFYYGTKYCLIKRNRSVYQLYFI